MTYQTRDAEVEAWVGYVKRSGILDRMQRVYACAIVHHEDEPNGPVTSDDVYDIGHGLAAVQSAMKSSAALSEARDAVLEFEERFSQFSEVICTG